MAYPDDVGRGREARHLGPVVAADFWTRSFGFGFVAATSRGHLSSGLPRSRLTRRTGKTPCSFFNSSLLPRGRQFSVRQGSSYPFKNFCSASGGFEGVLSFF